MPVKWTENIFPFQYLYNGYIKGLENLENDA